MVTTARSDSFAASLDTCSLRFERTVVVHATADVEEFSVVYAYNNGPAATPLPNIDFYASDGPCEKLAVSDLLPQSTDNLPELATEFCIGPTYHRIGVAPRGLLEPSEERPIVAHFRRSGLVDIRGDTFDFCDPLLPMIRNTSIVRVIFPDSPSLGLIRAPSAEDISSRMAVWRIPATDQLSIPIRACAKPGPIEPALRLLESLVAELRIAMLRGLVTDSLDWLGLLERLLPAPATEYLLDPTIHCALLDALKPIFGFGSESRLQRQRIVVRALETAESILKQARSGTVPLGRLRSIQPTPSEHLEKHFQDVIRVRPGRKEFSRYEARIEQLLSALFAPSLVEPERQVALHEGRQVVDITYRNLGTDNFFGWLARSEKASHVFVECKNYTREVGNPELQQLLNRFSDNRGRFGLLVCRKFDDKERFLKRCRDAADDGKGFVVVLDDDDLRTLVAEHRGGMPNRLLYERWKHLVF